MRFADGYRMIIGATYALIGSNLELCEDVLIDVNNGRISRLIIGGKKSEADIFYSEAVLVPGFINMHTHIGDSVAREKAYGMSIFEAVARPNSIKFKILSETPSETLVEAMVTALREMASRGITTLFDFREGGVLGVKLLRDAISKFPLNGFAMGRPDGCSVEDVLKISDGLGLSSLNRFQDEELINFARKVRTMGKYLAFHCSETLEQREESIEKFGISDISRALRLGLDFDFVVHLNYAEEEELVSFAQRNKLLVFCPRANLYLGLKPPPIAHAIELGIPFSLGTDNVMLNSPDMFRELETTVRLARIQGVVPDPKQLLAAITVIPSKALNLKTGIIDVGYQADFFVFDLAKPNVAFISDIYRAIVLRGSEMNIIQTYIAGKPILKVKDALS